MRSMQTENSDFEPSAFTSIGSTSDTSFTETGILLDTDELRFYKVIVSYSAPLLRKTHLSAKNETVTRNTQSQKHKNITEE